MTDHETKMIKLTHPEYLFIFLMIDNKIVQTKQLYSLTKLILKEPLSLNNL